MAVTDAGTPGNYKAGPDREVATQDLNAALQDKGFLVTSTADIINWARTASSIRAMLSGLPAPMVSPSEIS